jgi:hypothetical protein
MVAETLLQHSAAIAQNVTQNNALLEHMKKRTR